MSIESCEGTRGGFTLVSAMVGMAAVSTLTLGLSSITANSVKMQRGAETMHEAFELELTLTRILSSRDRCEEALRGDAISGEAVTIDSRFFQGGVIRKGSIWGRNWQVERVRLPSERISDREIVGNLMILLKVRNPERTSFSSPVKQIEIPISIRTRDDDPRIVETCNMGGDDSGFTVVANPAMILNQNFRRSGRNQWNKLMLPEAIEAEEYVQASIFGYQVAVFSSETTRPPVETKYSDLVENGHTPLVSAYSNNTGLAQSAYLKVHRDEDQNRFLWYLVDRCRSSKCKSAPVRIQVTAYK